MEKNQNLWHFLCVEMMENFIFFFFNNLILQGITVKLDDNNDLIVARIITGSMIAKQGK